MTRVLSGGVLILLAVAAVWFSPAWLFLCIAELLVVLACHEFAALTRASHLPFPFVVSTLAAALVCASFAQTAFGGHARVPIDVVLMTALVTLGALSLTSWRGGRDAVASASASLLPTLYFGLPIGAIVAIREASDRKSVV